jgi:hypothetical protein
VLDSRQWKKARGQLRDQTKGLLFQGIMAAPAR